MRAAAFSGAKPRAGQAMDQPGRRDILAFVEQVCFTGIGLGLLIGVTLTMAGVYRGMVDDAVMLLNTVAPTSGWCKKTPRDRTLNPPAWRDDVYRSSWACRAWRALPM